MDKNKADMKKSKITLLRNDGGKQRQEDYPTLAVFLQKLGSLLAFFHLCLVSELFSGPSKLETNFCCNFFPSVYSLTKYSPRYCILRISIDIAVARQTVYILPQRVLKILRCTSIDVKIGIQKACLHSRF